MKVVNLGHGGFGIEPESPADSVQTLTPDQLQRSDVSAEAINIYRRYLERTLSGSRDLPAGILSSFKQG
jgi:hypothetical protein